MPPPVPGRSRARATGPPGKDRGGRGRTDHARLIHGTSSRGRPVVSAPFFAYGRTRRALAQQVVAVETRGAPVGGRWRPPLTTSMRRAGGGAIGLFDHRIRVTVPREFLPGDARHARVGPFRRGVSFRRFVILVVLRRLPGRALTAFSSPRTSPGAPRGRKGRRVGRRGRCRARPGVPWATGGLVAAARGDRAGEGLGSPRAIRPLAEQQEG